VTLNPDFKVTAVIRPVDALDLFCAQLTRQLFAIAKFLLHFVCTVSLFLPICVCQLELKYYYAPAASLYAMALAFCSSVANAYLSGTGLAVAAVLAA